MSETKTLDMWVLEFLIVKIQSSFMYIWWGSSLATLIWLRCCALVFTLCLQTNKLRTRTITFEITDRKCNKQEKVYYAEKLGVGMYLMLTYLMFVILTAVSQTNSSRVTLDAKKRQNVASLSWRQKKTRTLMKALSNK